MNITELKLSELIPTRKKCIAYKPDGNTIVKPYKELYCLEQITQNPLHRNFYLEIIEPERENASSRLWEDFGVACLDRLFLHNDTDLNKTNTPALTENQGIDCFIEQVESAVENNHFVRKSELELLHLLGKNELLERCVKGREEYAKKQEESEEVEREQRQKETEAEKQRKQEKINNAISEAEKCIVEKKEFYNTEIKNTTIVNMLMKKHGINVPLKTQGWINSTLAMVTFPKTGDFKVSYNFYKENLKTRNKATNSTVFRDYLVKLVEAVEKSYKQAA